MTVPMQSAIHASLPPLENTGIEGTTAPDMRFHHSI